MQHRTYRGSEPGQPAFLKPVTGRQVRYATIIALLAWAFAVYDFILFGTLLPKVGETFGWDAARQAEIATWVALGTVAVALGVGPVVDRFGRRAGVMFTVGGAALCSALTAVVGSFGALPLIIVRALSGLGYAEQAVNGTYLSELYSSAEDERLVAKRGFIYSLVQGGWPIGALLAAGLTAVLLPRVGWAGCFLFAAVPSLGVAIGAYWLRESPQFEAIKAVRALHARGSVREAERLAAASGVIDSHDHAGFATIFSGPMRRATVALGGSHLLNWFAVQVFGVLGTTVLIAVHHVSFENSLIILLLSNAMAYLGYLAHGFLGDRLGRRNVIAGGWMIGSLVFTAMLYAPHNTTLIVALYGLGQFFVIGPYSCLLFFVGESYPTAVRATGASAVNGIGPMGAVFAGLAATALLKSGHDWQAAAFYCGAIPCFLSGAMMLLARPVHSATEAEIEVASLA